ncbi:Mycophenolic acid acyl-glucuronide esterase, mitochondrial [Chytriomyces hyalinus]|nr:Mycophenolic acid acyl-glucuronide esterase, mitochondrial [Chytriomyces hyalinus]
MTFNTTTIRLKCGRQLTAAIVLPNTHGASLKSREDVPAVLLVNGFRSTFRNSRKATHLAKFATSTLETQFITYDHAGHGSDSDTPFKECTMTMWKNDLCELLVTSSHLLGTNKRVLLVGASMGLHLSLLAAHARPEKVAGIIGVGGSLNCGSLVRDFENNVEHGCDVWIRPSSYDSAGYPIYRKLVESIWEEHIPEHGFTVQCPIELVHGMRDGDVHFQTAIDTAESVTSDRVSVVLVKDGDHRMSEDHHLHFVTAAITRLASLVS